MSTLAVTSIITANTTTNLTLSTGNTSAAAIVAYSDGSGISFKNNATTNAAFMAGNGNFSVGAGNTALYKLDIRGAAAALINATSPTQWISTDSGLSSGALFSQFNTVSNMGIFGTYTNHNLSIYTNNTERLRVDTSGNTGIGTSSPAAKLHVVGSTQITSSLGVGTAASGTTGEIRATNNITAYYTSDRTYKENIVVIADANNKLKKINGVNFDWTQEFIDKSGGEDGYFVRKHDVGVIAQEILEVIPEAVAQREDGTLAVRYEKIIPLLIESIKELNKKVEELETVIKSNNQ